MDGEPTERLVWLLRWPEIPGQFLRERASTREDRDLKATPTLTYLGRMAMQVAKRTLH